MKVTLSYTVCSCRPWNPKFNSIGAYSLREKKTAEEVRAEKDAIAQYQEAQASRAVYTALSQMSETDRESLGESGLARLHKEELKRIQQEEGKKVSPYRILSKTVFDIQGDTCYFLIGSWHRLKEAFEKEGQPYTIKDARDKSLLPAPDYSCLADVEFRPGQLETLALLTSQDCGLICSNVSFGKSFIIRQLCKVYPTLNILVVCQSGEVVKELFRDIGNDLPGQVGLLNMNNTNVSGKRIIVTTSNSMHKIKPEQVQLLVVDECHSFGCNSSGETLLKFCFCRRFGFTATPIRNQGDYKAFESLFGPVLQQVSFKESEEVGSVTPIKYSMVSIGKRLPYLCDMVEVETLDHNVEWVEPDKVSEEDTPTGRKTHRKLPDTLKQRLFYYNNKLRDAKIVETFKQVHAAAPDKQIMIMVQSIEHLIRIREKLPFLAIAHGERGKLDKYKTKKGLEHVDMSKYEQSAKDLAITKAAFEKGTLRCLIATGIFKQGVNLKHLAVLIRADGAVSGIPSVQIPGRLARLADNKPVAYLIDFTDDFCEEAEARADRRATVYRKSGWQECEYLEMLQEIKEVEVV